MKKAKEIMEEVKDLIGFYEHRQSNWLLAAEFILERNSTPRFTRYCPSCKRRLRGPILTTKVCRTCLRRAGKN
jgi:hypothetical protein